MLKSMYSKAGKLFTKTEEGKDIFHPWMYPGEAFILNNQKKKHIIFILVCLTASILFWEALFIYMGYFELIALTPFGTLAGTILGVHFMLYLYLISRFRNKVQLYKVPKDLRIKKSILIPWIGVIFQIQALYVFLTDADLTHPLGFLYFVLLSASTILMTFVFCRLIQTRGYLFKDNTD